MKTEKELERLIGKIDETKETLLVLHVNEEDDFATHYCGSNIEVAAGIATILYDGMKKDADADLSDLADAILKGVTHVLETPSFSAIRLMLKLTSTLEKSQKKLVEEIDAAADDDDDEENCEECENNRWCPLPNAIKYRKEHGIPKPEKKKNKKGGRKIDVK